MSIQARTYQDTFVFSLSKMFGDGKKKLIGHLPTGGGKTVCFSLIAKRYIDKQQQFPDQDRKSVLILVHRKELLTQTRNTLFKLCRIAAHAIVPGTKYIPVKDVYVGMVESTNRRVSKLKNIGLVIIDEAHIAAFNKLHQYFTDSLIIGVTATPQSASRKNPMKNHYEDIVSSVQISDLIRDGFLAQNITIAPKEIVDRAELSVKGSDFDEKLMGEKYSAPKFIKSTIHAYEKHAKGKKTIIFNANIAHSIKVAEAFRIAGYNCIHIDGTTPKGERDAAFQWLKVTPDAILCNVGIATTGFDEPTIECVIVNKATQSMPLWLQMTGRGGRIIDELFISTKQVEYTYPLSIKNRFIIIDMGANGITHGDWNDDRDWYNIFHNPKKPGKSDGVAPRKSCEQCEALIATSVKTCPYCGYVYPETEIEEENSIMRDFIVITKNINVTTFIDSGKEKGHKPYASFFQLARTVAKEVKSRVRKLTEKEYEIALKQYNILAEEWCENSGKKFNQWHKDKAKETLCLELKSLYPKWQSPILLPDKEEEKTEAKVIAFKPQVSLSNIYDITL